MPDYFLFSAEDAEVIRRDHDKIRKDSLNTVPGESPLPNRSPETFVACLPLSGLPARDDLTPGSVQAAIFRIQEDDDGEQVLERVEDLCQTVFNLETTAVYKRYVPVTRDKFGSWLHVGSTGGTAASTSTTTTLGPTLDQDCDGRPKWNWNEAEQIWELDSEDQCSNTTSSSSTSSSSSTTADPCECASNTTADPSTSSSSTSSSSSTTPAPCEPTYPTFCGTEDGQCTYTYCSNDDIPPPDIECTSTTTTGEPTTTQECTSTTLPPCGSGCLWRWVPVGGFSGFDWLLISVDCSIYVDDCDLVQCDTCDEPSYEPPMQCPNGTCPEDTTACRTQSLPSPPGPSPCSGKCCWGWRPDLFSWIQLSRQCSGGRGCPNCEKWNCDNRGHYSAYNGLYTDCGCLPPSAPGDGWCDLREAPCGGNCPSCPEYEGGVPPTDPCNNSSTSSTTTLDPCGTGCIFKGDGADGWDLIEDNCEGGCVCDQPGRASEDDCETEFRPCREGTTTIPPSTSSTSTSSTSTTTTLPWWCLQRGPNVSIDGDCLTNLSCEQMADAGGPADCIPDVDCNYCGGPYSTEAGCYEGFYCAVPPPTTSTSTSSSSSSSSSSSTSSSSSSTSSTTTCDPNFNCLSEDGCSMACPSGTWIASTAPGCGEFCTCDFSDADMLLVGTPCTIGLDGYFVPCCNPCDGSTQPCSGTTTTTLPP